MTARAPPSVTVLRRDNEMSCQDEPIPHAVNNDWSWCRSQDYDSDVTLPSYRFAAACHAAAARRIRFGCNTPNWGDCPNGAAGGTSNHGVLYGSSTAFARLNFVG